MERESAVKLVKKLGENLMLCGFWRNDEEIALMAIQNSPKAMKYIGLELQKDRDFIIRAVQQNGLALLYAHNKYKNDREIVLEAVQQNGLALGYASHKLRKDITIARTAVQQNGLALKFVPEEINQEVDEDAVQQNVSAIKFASNWGGKRVGAGRPQSSTKILKTVKLEKELLDKLEKLEGTFTDKIVRGLEKIIEEETK